MMIRQYLNPSMLRVSASIISRNIGKRYSVVVSNIGNNNNNNSKFIKSNEVIEALKNNIPIVALESTIISHGMPYPKNYETAIEVENIVRENNACPATIAVLDGKIHIGLNNEQLKLLATEGTKGTVKKCSRRDISYVVSKKEHGATTVAGTLAIANLFGYIDIFVTGGIGGVHRGEDLDISADLIELGRNNNIMVVCAGVKSILDIPRTLEFLETQGVAVIGYDTDEFPSFFTRRSGLNVPMRLNTIEDCAKWIETNKVLNLNSGSILAVPNSEPFADETFIDKSVNQALDELEKMKSDNPTFSGKEATPFLLKRVNELTGGNSLKSNIALVKNNAQIGAKIAAATATATNEKKIIGFTANSRRSYSTSSPRPDMKHSKCVYIFGGSTVDLVGRPTIPNATLANTSTPGVVQTSYGGVGRNIAEALGRSLRNNINVNNDSKNQNQKNIKFISFVGNDTYGKAILDHLTMLGIDVTDVYKSNECSTAIYQAVLDSNGDLYCAIADMDIMNMMDMQKIEHIFDDQLMKSNHKPWLVVLDGNLSKNIFHYVCKKCAKNSVPIWFEPTSIEKAKLASVENLKYINFISPNLSELKMIYDELIVQYSNDRNEDRKTTAATIEDMALHVLNAMSKNAYLVITLGEKGVCLACLNVDKENNTEVVLNYLKPDVIDMEMVNATGAGDTLVGGTISSMMILASQNDYQDLNNLDTSIDTLLSKQDYCNSVAFGMKAASLSIQSENPVSKELDNLLL